MIRKQYIKVQPLFLFLPFIILLVWNQIKFYFFSYARLDTARYQLLNVSLKIAIDYFPIGTGFGTFDSHYSGIKYSPLYSIYGVSNIYGLTQNAPDFVSDSFWPMILGKTGVIGFIIYLFAIITLFNNIQNIRNISIPYYASLLCGFLYLCISSIAETAFVNPIAVPSSVIIGLLISKNYLLKE